MPTYEELRAKAKWHDEQSEYFRERARDARQAELRAKPIADRIIYAAHSRCPCGAGLAYDPCFEDKNGVFAGPLSGYWDCSAIILGTADKSAKHTAQLPFAFYEVKSEQQPTANGATTRPKAQG